MNDEQQRELIRCAQNATRTIRPANQRRERAARALTREGYLIPLSERSDPEFRPESLSNVYGQTLTLTGQGRAYLLTLIPADFAGHIWPNPQDIEQIQRALAE